MKKNEGITLIALIVTIIIMIILVTITVQILISTGLIEKALDAGEETKEKYEEEATFGDNINISGNMYNTVDDYMNALYQENNSGD